MCKLNDSVRDAIKECKTMEELRLILKFDVPLELRGVVLYSKTGRMFDEISAMDFVDPGGRERARKFVEELLPKMRNNKLVLASTPYNHDSMFAKFYERR